MTKPAKLAGRSTLPILLGALGALAAGCSNNGNGTASGGPEAGLDGEVAVAADGGGKQGATDATVPRDSSTATDASSAPDALQPNDASPNTGPPAVQLIGRFDLTTPSAPQAEWSGSAMRARFTGASVAAKLGGNGNYFAVLVDGVAQPTLRTDGGAGYPITSGLTAGPHDVLVFRRDEAFDEPAKFLGFDFGATGALLPPPVTPSRRIEIIGDSISAGFGDECANASDDFTAATENEYIAYGPLTARALGAEVHVVAWSGKGLYRNLDATTTETMPILWQRTLPTDTTSVWDPSRWIPDVVVINLGTNDYNANATDPSSNFQATYADFVTHLKSVYPNVFVFGAVGPMLGGGSYAAAKTAIQNVVAMRGDAGDPRMQLVEFPTQSCGSDGSSCGCAGHPNVNEHQVMATILEGAIRPALGW